MSSCLENKHGHKYKPTASQGIQSCVHCGKKSQYDDVTKTWKEIK